jgi:hypothetical protein
LCSPADSCELVPIDFGAAFGHGQILPVVELVPVRLTRQLRTVCEPFGLGLLALHMERALHGASVFLCRLKAGVCLTLGSVPQRQGRAACDA